MWAVAALAFALLRIPYVSVPLERDEGEYAYIAQRSTHGEVPYRDAFDQKPPGVFLAYRGAFALFGQSIEGIHLRKPRSLLMGSPRTQEANGRGYRRSPRVGPDKAR